MFLPRSHYTKAPRCVSFQVSHRRVSNGLCEASKSHLTAEKRAQKENSTLFFQNKSVQFSCVLQNMMEIFSFSSRARQHQVFGTLKEAVKLNSCSLNYFTQQTGGEESKQDPGLVLERALSWQSGVCNFTATVPALLCQSLAWAGKEEPSLLLSSSQSQFAAPPTKLERCVSHG